MYNKGNMIEKVTNNNDDNTQMSYYRYEYYLDGNVSKQNRNGVNCYYDYDEFSRITDEDYGREEIDYYYDAAGNRTLKKICDDNGDTDVNYTYDLNNRLLEESTNYYSKNEIDVTKYVYDNNGNQIKKIGYITKGVNGSPSQDLVSENELNNTYEIYKYNEFNEMTSFESNKESKWEYAYLPNGLRYRKSNASNFDRYVWDRNGNIIAEMNGEGNLTNKYVRGNKLISKDGNEYFGYDGHGSVVNISDESGKSIKSYDYDAFGVELNKDANDTNLFRYCGEQYDNETDSIYLRARYYSPSLGRFTTEDTYWNSSNRIYGDKEYKDGEIKYPDYKAIMQDSNLYSYCIQNPMVYYDRNGKDAYAVASSWVPTISSVDGPYPYADFAAAVVVAGAVIIDGVVYTSKEIKKAWNAYQNSQKQKYEKAKKDGKQAPNHSTKKQKSEKDNTNLPTESEPNSSMDLLNSKGELKQRRYYGSDGKAQKDIDYQHGNNNGKHSFPHEHTWDWSKGYGKRI